MASRQEVFREEMTEAFKDQDSGAFLSVKMK